MWEVWFSPSGATEDPMSRPFTESSRIPEVKYNHKPVRIVYTHEIFAKAISLEITQLVIKRLSVYLVQSGRYCPYGAKRSYLFIYIFIYF
jgi:hypothetical protein